MGRNPRLRPARLASKLLQIRKNLGLSQNQMIRSLGFEGQLIQSHISAYEQEGDKGREPPLGVLLQYARVAGIPVEALINDDLDLESLERSLISSNSSKVRRSPRSRSKTE
jgi:transcriptional regulator with XRE-family HTH domain